jgi:hypothetical protein
MVEASSEAGGSENFDQLLKRLTTELKQADRHLTGARLPQATLEELSESVDHIRATTWAALNSIADEFTDAEQTPTLLTLHRIQRLRALLNTLGEEMDTGHINRSAAGAEELCAALGLAYKKLYYLIHGKPVPSEEK